MQKLHTMFEMCKVEKKNFSTHSINGQFFLQQMFAQLVVYSILSSPLDHSSRSLQFINTSPEDEKTFILKPHRAC
jgi:hypothetical protein